MIHIYHDGGRKAAGYAKPASGDCFPRAVAIATGLPYQQVCDMVVAAASKERKGVRKRGISSPTKGIYVRTAHKIMADLGWIWVPTMGIGTGCTVHMQAEELPRGPLVVSISKHFVAVIDGILFDNHDCTRGGTRCVYGYYRRP